MSAGEALIGWFSRIERATKHAGKKSRRVLSKRARVIWWSSNPGSVLALVNLSSSMIGVMEGVLDRKMKSRVGPAISCAFFECPNSWARYFPLDV